MSDNPNHRISQTCTLGFHETCKNATCACGCHVQAARNKSFAEAAEQAAQAVVPSSPNLTVNKVVEAEQRLLISVARVADAASTLDDARKEAVNVFECAQAYRGAEAEALQAMQSLVDAYKEGDAE